MNTIPSFSSEDREHEMNIEYDYWNHGFIWDILFEKIISI